MKRVLSFFLGGLAVALVVGYSDTSFAMGAKIESGYVFRLEGPKGKTGDFDKITYRGEVSAKDVLDPHFELRWLMIRNLDAINALIDDVHLRCLSYRLTRGGKADEIYVVGAYGTKVQNFVSRRNYDKVYSFNKKCSDY